MSGMGLSSGQSGYLVDENGEIDFPVLGKLKLAGLDRKEITDSITNILRNSKLVDDAIVKVEYTGLYVTILGEGGGKRINIDKDRLTFFELLAQTDYKVIVTTDHGSIRCDKPVKIIGDKNTNTNLRYKLGKNLNCQSKDVFVISNPRAVQLPAPNISTTYVFATGNDFFAYPNNYSYYVQYFKDTFQHGGISMEEMIIPLITMKGRKK